MNPFFFPSQTCWECSYTVFTSPSLSRHRTTTGRAARCYSLCLSKGKDQPHTLTPLSILKDVSAVQWGNAAVFLHTRISPDPGCMWIKDMVVWGFPLVSTYPWHSTVIGEVPYKHELIKRNDTASRYLAGCKNENPQASQVSVKHWMGKATLPKAAGLCSLSCWRVFGGISGSYIWGQGVCMCGVGYYLRGDASEDRDESSHHIHLQERNVLLNHVRGFKDTTLLEVPNQCKV